MVELNNITVKTGFQSLESLEVFQSKLLDYDRCGNTPKKQSDLLKKNPVNK